MDNPILNIIIMIIFDGYDLKNSKKTNIRTPLARSLPTIIFFLLQRSTTIPPMIFVRILGSMEKLRTEVNKTADFVVLSTYKLIEKVKIEVPSSDIILPNIISTKLILYCLPEICIKSFLLFIINILPLLSSY